MMSKILLLVVVLFCVFSLCSAQVCQQYDIIQARATGEVCVPFLSPNIYVPYALTGVQSLLDNYINTTQLWMIRAAYEIFPPVCYRYLLSLVCHAAFPTCGDVITSDNKTLIVGIPQCQSTCQDAMAACSIIPGMERLLNCSSVNPLSLQPVWPDGGYLVNGVFVPCSTALFNNPNTTYVPPSITSCPAPLVLKRNPTETDLPCWVSCPDFSYTPEKWVNLVKGGFIAGILSLVVVTFMIASYLLIPAKRAFPSRVIIYMFIGCFIQCGTFPFFGLDSQYTVLCVDEREMSKQGNNWKCVLQGILVTYGALCIGTWLVILSVNLYFQIVKQKVIPPSWEKYYLVVGWGFPMLFVISTLATSSYAAQLNTSFCFIHYPKGRIPGFDSIQYPLYYMPLGIYILISATILVIVAAHIFEHLRKTRKFFDRSKLNHSSMYESNIRIIILSFFLLFNFCWMFAYRLYVERNQDGWVAQMFTWISCRLMAGWGFPGVSFGDCPSDIAPEANSFTNHLVNNILNAGLGVFLFLLFGSDRAIYIAWMRFFREKHSKIRTIFATSYPSQNTSSTQQSGVEMETDEDSQHQQPITTSITFSTLNSSHNSSNNDE